MNITDVKQIQKDPNKPSSDEDKLNQIFSGQKELMKDYKEIAEKHFKKVFGTDIKISPLAWEGGELNLHTKIGNFLIKEMLDSAIQELSESIQTLKNWKAWKQTEVPSDVNHFKEEMADALHFYIESCILSGITSEELHELYFKKHGVNKFRIKSNY